MSNGSDKTINVGDTNRLAEVMKDDEAEGDRADTFRDRRLTFTSNNIAAAAVALLDNEDEEKEDDTDYNNDRRNTTIGDDLQEDSSFRERRLSYATHFLSDAAAQLQDLEDSEDEDLKHEEHEQEGKHGLVEESLKRKRGGDNQGSPSNKVKRFKSRVVHASLPAQHSDQNSKLYRHVVPNPANNHTQQSVNKRKFHQQLENDQPEWKQRHDAIPDDDLPFPRHVVGTYSCHGVEPLYDSSSSDNEDHQRSKSIAKINQDRGGVAYPYGNCPRTSLLAAYDGHGDGGELVAQYALHQVQRLLEKHPCFESNIREAMIQTFLKVDESLTEETNIEPWYSGCTAIVTLVRGKQLIVGNCGDSRAVLATKDSDNQMLKAVDLSQDQNPDTPGEKERILSMGGYISPPPEEGLSARVWLDSNFTQIGLAMARSIGDHAVKSIGVIAEPEVKIHDIDTEKDEFVIIATDGVWEFISSQEAVDIVQKHFVSKEEESCCASKACQDLIETAAAKWHQYEGDYRDDITALVVRINKLSGYMDKMEQQHPEKTSITSIESSSPDIS